MHHYALHLQVRVDGTPLAKLQGAVSGGGGGGGGSDGSDGDGSGGGGDGCDDGGVGRVLVSALDRGIAAGEEISVTYMPDTVLSFRSVTARQQWFDTRLSPADSFTCRCTVCALPPTSTLRHRSDEARASLKTQQTALLALRDGDERIVPGT
jgi:hypothetical protein